MHFFGGLGQFLYILLIYALFRRFRTVFVYFADICTFLVVSGSIVFIYLAEIGILADVSNLVTGFGRFYFHNI